MRRQGSAGFSLSELMITVAIVGIITAVALPSYQGYVRRQNRSVAKATLLDVANRQEQFFADNKQYAAVLTSLGYATNPFSVDRSGTVFAAGSAAALYEITVTTPAPPRLTFTLSAVPRNAQTADTQCGTLALTNTGARTPTTSGCW